MIEFTYDLFSDTPSFPIHLQYGAHEEALYLHTHADFSELVIVLDGKAEHLVGSDHYPIAKGTVFVVGKDTAHGFADTKHLTICNIMFQDTVFSQIHDMRQIPGFQAMFVLEPHYAQRDHFISKLRLSMDALAETERMIAMLLHEQHEQRPGWQDMVLSTFHAFCIQLSRLYAPQTEDGLLKIADAIAYLEDHFTEDIMLPRLAEQAGYSERQFLRLFREILGTTPNRYLVGLRIAQAKRLLATTALPVGEIAWRCGYDDQNYFARQFKAQTGQTPSIYRMMVR